MKARKRENLSSTLQATKQLVFKAHKYQSKLLRAYQNPKIRIICACSGIQGGKSLLGAVMLRWHIEHDKRKDVNFLVTAPDFKTMAQSTRVTFDKVLHDLGTMNEMAGEFRLHDGRSIFMRTVVKNPWAVEGIPKCAFAWCDEAGLYPRAAWVNIQSRVAMVGGKIILTTTPYGSPWFSKDIVNRAQNGAPDIAFERWTSKDNPAFSNEEYERMKAKLSPREFERKFMGVDNKLEGLIFDEFGPQNWTDAFSLPQRTEYYGGIDWGFDHPMALVVRALPMDGHGYTVSIFKKSGLSTTQAVDLILAKQKIFNVTQWYCGHDRPDIIADLAAQGVKATKYFEGNEDFRQVNAGNQKHAEFIRQGVYKIFKGLDQWEELEDEYLSYSWKKKDFEGETAKEKPNDINDDLMAAERYCTVGTMHLMESRLEEPKIPLNAVYHVDNFDPSEPSDEDKNPMGW